MQIKSFRFNLQELGGAVGDLGTLLPLMVALILINGLNATMVLIGVGLFYIVSGLYYRIPAPVQPLKAVAAIAISLSLSANVIGAAGLLMAAILLLLSLTNLISVVVKLFPKAVVRGIQISIGLILLRRGMEFVFSEQVFINKASYTMDIGQVPIGVLLAVSALTTFVLFKFVFFRQTQRIPASLALLSFGLVVGFVLYYPLEINKLALITTSIAFPSIVFPSAADFWLAFTALVIPQLPLTLGNAIVGTSNTARTYFQEKANRVTPKALATSMGLANLAAGLLGAMPMCHGSGGLTAHYKFGARTGAASIMVGGLLLALGLIFGKAALPFLSLIPLPVLGVLLAIGGVYHAFLVRDLLTKEQFVVAGTVAVVTVTLGNLGYGFATGILLNYLLIIYKKGSYGFLGWRDLARRWAVLQLLIILGLGASPKTRSVQMEQEQSERRQNNKVEVVDFGH
jgi:SulP family sulfate permease